MEGIIHLDLYSLYMEYRVNMYVRVCTEKRTKKTGHLGSSTAANWVAFDLNVSCSSC